MKSLTADGIQHQKNAQSGRSLAQQSAMDLLGLTRTFESSNHSSPHTKSPTSATDADFEAAYLLMTSDPLKSSSFASLGIPSAATPPNFDDLVRTRFSPQRETDSYPFPAHSARSVAYNNQPVGSNSSSVHALGNSQVGPTGSIEKQHLNADLAEQSIPNPVQGTNYPPQQVQQIPTSNYHTPPPISPVPPTTSTVSPNTRVLLNTFNNLNYSVSSKTAMNDWGASNQQYSHLAPNNSAPPSRNSTGPGVPNILGQSQWETHPGIANSSGQSTELLSMTETSALENFLDSIASDVSFDKLAKQWSSIDPGSSANSLKEQMQDGTAARISIQPTQRPDVGEKSILPGRVLVENGEVKEQSKQVLTDKEKKQNHTISEQKRRLMIRNSFLKLSQLLDRSKFEQTLQDRQKSKSKRKAMSKYNVLNRAVIEIELLEAQNEKLRKLCQQWGE